MHLSSISLLRIPRLSLLLLLLLSILVHGSTQERGARQNPIDTNGGDDDNNDFTFHFIHVPKSGGSTVTAYLRQYVDCQPPGFCCTAPGLPVGVCNETRLCAAVIGCTRHEPHIELLSNSRVVSVLSLRQPLARAVSGFRYPYHHGGHHEFGSFVRDARYQNVAVKMLNGMDPYATLVMQPHHLQVALQRLAQVDAIILTEAMEDCIHALFHMLPGNKQPQPVPVARPSLSDHDNNNGANPFEPSKEEVELFQNMNELDIQLYEQAMQHVCAQWSSELSTFCAQVIPPSKGGGVEEEAKGNNNNITLEQLEEKLQQSEAWILKKLEQHEVGKYPIPSPLPWTPPSSWLHASCQDAYFHHFPGHYKGGRDPAVAAYFKEPKSFPPPPDRVLFAFPYATSKPEEKDSLAERMYKHLDYPYVNYLEGEHSFQRWWSKVGPLMELLAGKRSNSRLTRALHHQYDYIVVHDASDVLLMQPPTELIERFEAYECDILMGTTDADWPPEPALHKFESGVAPWSKRHAHITAGMFMARTSTLLELMTDLTLESKSFRGSFNDQRHWRRLHGRAYPRVKADSCCRIFARRDEYMNAP